MLLIKNIKMPTKKSQIYSQIFIYILAILLTSFILVYGYNAVKNFQIRAEKVACLKFQNDLKSAVESISSDYGSVERKNLQLCGDYKSACFVDEDSHGKSNPIFNSEFSDGSPVTNYPIIIDSISSRTGKNVFLIDGGAPNSFYTGKISVNSDVLCIKAINNQISLRLEGRGDHTLVSEWEE